MTFAQGWGKLYTLNDKEVKKMTFWNIYMVEKNGDETLVDTLPFDDDMDDLDVFNSLVNDGYSGRILVALD